MKKSVKISKKKYIVNGEEYKSIEDMPPKARKIFEDKNKDGIPDIVENSNDRNSSTTIEINGKKYNNWDEVPEEYQKYRELRKSSLRSKNAIRNEGVSTNRSELKPFSLFISVMIKIFIITATSVLFFLLYKRII